MLSGTDVNQRTALSTSILCLISALLPFLIYLPMMLRQSTRQYDYIVHLREAYRISQGGSAHGPHMLFHWLTASIAKFTTFSIATSALTLLSLCIILTAILLFICAHKKIVNKYLLIFFPVLSLTVQPFFILYLLDKHSYFGYIGTNVYHNPTMLLLKPFIVSVFLIAAFIFIDNRSSNPTWVKFILPVFVLLSALAKPSFLIVFVPGLSIYLISQYLCGKKFDWKLLIIALILPTALTLGWQYWTTYSENQIQGLYKGESSIAFAPLTLVRLWSKYLLAKFFLSIAFPIALLLTFWNSVKIDHYVVLSWLIFIVGVSQYYLLIEQGPRAAQGNFAWGAQVGAFLLFATSVRHFLSKSTKDNFISKCKFIRWSFCAALLAMHLLAGGVFYALEYISPQQFW